MNTMQSLKRKKIKVRPSSASGLLQSKDVQHLLDELRPVTAPGKSQIGFDPTFLTSRHHVAGKSTSFSEKGRQVHGGIPQYDLKANVGRRATLCEVDLDKIQRPLTAAEQKLTKKLEDQITLGQLNEMRQAFEEGGIDNSGNLNLEEFKEVFLNFFSIKGKSEDQITELFMKIDSSADGEITWNEFCTYMQLEYAEKEASYLRSKKTAFYVPATIESSPHREQVLTICHTSDNTSLCVSKDGVVSFWSPSLDYKRSKQLETSCKKSKWITDFVLMPQFNKLIISTGDREIQFHELSTFEPYCQISGLETTPLKMEYKSTGQDESILLLGDSLGCISIFILSSTGKSLRTWKKMPKVDGIANVNVDSVVSSENIKFVRWKVHNDWVSQLNYYESLRAVISCSNDSQTSLVIGQTIGSTNIESVGQSGYSGNQRKLFHGAGSRDNQPPRRQDADHTVFKIYKGVKTFDFSSEKNVIVTGGMDRLIRVWNPYVPSKPTGILRGHCAPIFYLCITAQDNRIFSVSTDKTVKVWDLNDQCALFSVGGKTHKIRGDLSAVHYNFFIQTLAIVTSDQVGWLTLKTRLSSSDLTLTHKEAIYCVKYNSSFKHVVTASEGSVIKVWDVETGHQVFEFSEAHNKSGITSVTFDSTQRRLISGGRDGCLKIWNYNNGHCLRTLQKDTNIDEVTSLTYVVMNRNRYIISVGWDRTINVFLDDTTDFRHTQQPYLRWDDDLINGHKEDILAVVSCPPNLLATSSFDGEVIVWNMVSGHILCHISSPFRLDASHGGENAVVSLVFLTSRSGLKSSAMLVSSGPQAIVHFWNVYNGGSLFGHIPKSEFEITAMTSDEENMILITADHAGFIYTWDLENYCLSMKSETPPRRIGHWRAHVQEITCLDIGETYDVLLTSSIDCTVRLWTMNGHFIGTFGQPKLWDINQEVSYQHPMVPYDVLVDPLSVPKHPIFNDHDTNDEIVEVDEVKHEVQSVGSTDDSASKEHHVNRLDDQHISNDLKERISKNSMGKRLRHEKLRQKTQMFDVGPNAYQSLTCYDLEVAPKIPSPPDTSIIDDPLNIKF
ncbi:WD repeat-containing protein 64-like isoform X2 [Xenia sp. Carnegie-2017]|uniref:WD repeat-containing protein 64-like isoform X2 n=1 Tax=Xenia sp. Carnegie-2017 TaxID=2897299 RepID=UPI001F037510|nr:WD repeat-containing protein 64-like isoform X2 [Xenia sp. Carnegie-2017]